MFHLAQWAQRGMRGQVSQAAVAAQYSYVSLYNNSPGPDVLVLRTLHEFNVSSLSMFMAAVKGVPVGSASGAVLAPIWTGQAVHAGQIYAGTSATALTPDWQILVGATVPWIMTGKMPLAIISPNWALVFTTKAVNVTLSLSLVWEAVPADELLDTSIPPFDKYRLERGL